MSEPLSPDELIPTRDHRFSFGLSSSATSDDPFGEPTRAPLDPVETLERLADLGAYGGISPTITTLSPMERRLPSATESSPGSPRCCAEPGWS